MHDRRPSRLDRPRAWLGVGLLLVSSLHAAMSQPPGKPSIEYQIKASYLYNFLKFVEWPGEAEPDRFVIGVLGEDRFGAALDAVDGERVRGRPVEVIRVGGLEDAARCHVLFISASEAPRLSRILEVLRDKGVLTVGEADRFIEQGGMINLIVRDDRVVFEINPGAVRHASLRIDSQLLQLGTRR